MNQNHYSGAQGQATGVVSRNSSDYSTSIDTIVGEQIGKGTRFRSLEASCDGDSRSGWSARGSSGQNPSETSPLALYARIFGEGYQDPNTANFVPDPASMVRRSVLSAVSEQRRSLLSAVSASDCNACPRSCSFRWLLQSKGCGHSSSRWRTCCSAGGGANAPL